MNDVELRPLLMALTASLILSYVLIIVWPRFVAPSPTPFVEGLLTEIRAQNYEVVYSHLSERWKVDAGVRDRLCEPIREDENAVRVGGFVESTWVEPDKVKVSGLEAWVPVYYRIKVPGGSAPRVYLRQGVVKLVYERARWRLDSLKVSKP